MMEIAGRKIGNGSPNFIVAEMSANHMKSLQVALDVVRKAAAAGVDAVKIQTLTPDSMTIDCDSPIFKVSGGTPWDGRLLYDLYSETPLPYEWHQEIFQECSRQGVICFSTPYDISAVDFLETLGCPAYKISSFEIFDTPLIEHAARMGKPMIMSTGVAGYDDIARSVETCFAVGNRQVMLLKCTSAYPTPPEEVNLLTLQKMQEDFGVCVGLSDHTISNDAAIGSVCLGGCVIEKHFTLKRSLGGPDASFSLEPNEMMDLVASVRKMETVLGRATYELSKSSAGSLNFSRSLFFVADLRKGETVNKENIRSIRPGYGLKPYYLNDVIGLKANKDISRGTPVSWDLLE